MISTFKFRLLLVVSPLFSFGQQLSIYPPPAKDFDHGSNIYTIQVTQGLVKKQSYVYVSYAGTDLTEKEWGYQQGKSFHYTIFSFSGTAIIEVTKNNSIAKTAVIRPSAIGIRTIATRSKGNSRSVSFELSRSGKFSVEFDDDLYNKEALMLFADSAEKNKDVPDLASPLVWKVNTEDKTIIVPFNKSILYFAPGIYEPGYFEIPQHVKQIYVAGGAFVRGYILANRNSEAPLLINGRGILSNDRWPFHYPVNTLSESEIDYFKWYKMIRINGGSHHRIEGITLVDASAGIIAVYSSHYITLENIKINAFRYNSDAANLHGDHNIIDNCFFRSNEDVIGINGNHTTIKNCSFWQLYNGSIVQLGWTPHNIGGDNLIEDCTILHAEWNNDKNPNVGFINIMNTTAPKTFPIIENFTVKNIYADTEILRFIDLRLLRNGKGQPVIIRNFNFDNIHLKRKKLNTPLFYFTGYDAANTISNINLKNIYINDTLLRENTTGLIKVDNFAQLPVLKQ